jgi:hypothetical protein
MNRCPVCGYDELDEPAFDDVGAPSYDICDCCGTQFGYHDARTPHAVLREKWVAKGMPWHSRTTPPSPGWNPLEQLRSVIDQPESLAIAKRKNKGALES